MIQKRYQYHSPTGIAWTDWFPFQGREQQQKQDNKLKNEYRKI